jgi:hypothetical protein
MKRSNVKSTLLALSALAMAWALVPAAAQAGGSECNDKCSKEEEACYSKCPQGKGPDAQACRQKCNNARGDCMKACGK